MMLVDVSRPALAFIQRKGGDLYVWFGTLGDGSLFEHVTTRRPPGRDFTAHEMPGGARLWLEARDGLREPSAVRVRRRPWPIGPIEVTWVRGPGGELGSAAGAGPLSA